MNKINIFLPAYNVGKSIVKVLREFDDVNRVLASRESWLTVLVINDNSTDNTRQLLDEAYNEYEWLVVHHNDANKGNAANIITGYQWGSAFASEVGSDNNTIVGCMDADGEHSPYAMLRHLRMIADGECDSVVGSIIFPDHDASYHDRNMMRFWGGMQAAMAGVDGMFYIQSPGYNLHKLYHVEMALELFEQYQKFFAQNTTEPFPRWGMHGVMIHLLAVGTGAHIKAVYLECFGYSPNRPPEKLVLQANAANAHMAMLQKFLPGKTNS